MKELFKILIVKYNFSTPAGEGLYFVAKGWLGKDASPSDVAPDEYGCAESVNNIVFTTFNEEVGGDVSTYRMYKALKENKKFAKVTKPLRGDIIISPTGYGGTQEVKNGHVGIMSDNGVIMSNKSQNGLFSVHYTLDSWKERYQVRGKYPIHFYRRIFKS